VSGPDATVLFEVEGPLARVVLNRPDKRNALDREVVEGVTRSLREAVGREGVRVVTLSGAGKDFCAGADLASLARIAEATVLENLEDAEALGELFLTIRRLPLPVIALVRGRALAGGCGLASACDLVLASEEASFGYPEVKIGFVPAMVMAILRRNVSEKIAFELIACGETFSATDARGFGLVNRVFPEATFTREAEDFALALARRSPSALHLSKRLLYQQDALGFEAAIRAGADVNVIARMTEDTRAGIARFLDGSRAGSTRTPS
jgi:methylglutaconyl-CoA hydratase